LPYHGNAFFATKVGVVVDKVTKPSRIWDYLDLIFQNQAQWFNDPSVNKCAACDTERPAAEPKKPQVDDDERKENLELEKPVTHPFIVNDPGKCSLCISDMPGKWIQCDYCDRWYHGVCVKLSDGDIDNYVKDDKLFTCPVCTKALRSGGNENKRDQDNTQPLVPPDVKLNNPVDNNEEDYEDNEEAQNSDAKEKTWLSDFLKSLALLQYEDRFFQKGIDSEQLLCLVTDDDLIQMKVKDIHRRAILKEISKLKEMEKDEEN